MWISVIASSSSRVGAIEANFEPIGMLVFARKNDTVDPTHDDNDTFPVTQSPNSLPRAHIQTQTQTRGIRLPHNCCSYSRLIRGFPVASSGKSESQAKWHSDGWASKKGLILTQTIKWHWRARQRCVVLPPSCTCQSSSTENAHPHGPNDTQCLKWQNKLPLFCRRYRNSPSNPGNPSTELKAPNRLSLRLNLCHRVGAMRRTLKRFSPIFGRNAHVGCQKSGSALILQVFHGINYLWSFFSLSNVGEPN